MKKTNLVTRKQMTVAQIMSLYKEIEEAAWEASIHHRPEDIEHFAALSQELADLQDRYEDLAVRAEILNQPIHWN